MFAAAIHAIFAPVHAPTIAMFIAHVAAIRFVAHYGSREYRVHYADTTSAMKVASGAPACHFTIAYDYGRAAKYILFFFHLMFTRMSPARPADAAHIPRVVDRSARREGADAAFTRFHA